MLITLILASALSDTKHSCCDPSMAIFASDPKFVAKHLAPVPFNFVAKEGKQVTYNDINGKPTSGFYVAPTKGVKTTIVMVHEWWGLNDYVKKEAEKIHDATGYGVLAVDLYEGKTASTPQDAGKYMSSVDAARAHAIIKGTIRELKSGDKSIGVKKSAKIGTIGWCFGGGWSLQTAIDGGNDVNACVMFYGMPETDVDRLAKIKAPVSVFWGHQDKWINDDVVNKFRDAMVKAGKSIEIKGYDADHAFANPSNAKFDKAASADSMSRTLAFFKKHLG